MLEEKWASPEDFATLFQYLWYRDFPMDAKMAVGARRVDWTIHIGVIVRKIADLMGLVTRFEEGRKDAMLRSTDGDEIALEWEWEDILGKEGKLKGNELRKLQNRKVWRPNDKEGLKYAVLITYTKMSGEETEQVYDELVKVKVYDEVVKVWKGTPWPLLFILIDFGKFEMLSSRRGFKKIRMSVFREGNYKELRSAPAFPWEVAGTRWSYQLKNDK